MKDFTEETYRESIPPDDMTALEYITFCLDHLFADKRHNSIEGIVDGLCFEELIGALLVAEDKIRQQAEMILTQEREYDILLESLDGGWLIELARRRAVSTLGGEREEGSKRGEEKEGGA